MRGDLGQPASEGMSKITGQEGSLGEVWASPCGVVLKSSPSFHRYSFLNLGHAVKWLHITYMGSTKGEKGGHWAVWLT